MFIVPFVCVYFDLVLIERKMFEEYSNLFDTPEPSNIFEILASSRITKMRAKINWGHTGVATGWHSSFLSLGGRKWKKVRVGQIILG